MILKPEPEYVDIDSPFTPLPKLGHFSEKTPAYAAVAPAIKTGVDSLWASCEDWPAFRRAAGDPEAGIPPGGPDRSRDVVTELFKFPARDGHLVELKMYKSPDVKENAILMYRMHGGGKLMLFSFALLRHLLMAYHLRLGSWKTRSGRCRECLCRHKPRHRRRERGLPTVGSHYFTQGESPH